MTTAHAQDAAEASLSSATVETNGELDIKIEDLEANTTYTAIVAGDSSEANPSISITTDANGEVTFTQTFDRNEGIYAVNTSLREGSEQPFDVKAGTRAATP